jgi:hypothetical protein
MDFFSLRGPPAYQTPIGLDASRGAPHQNQNLGKPPLSLGVSPVTVITFRDCIPNSALFHTQFHIHSTAVTGNVIYHTIFIH